MSQTLVHIVYIHGFQGNDTTFQSFPTDLQQHLAKLMPPRFKVQSSLYPTYKSVKPISFATRNFLDWLATQPPGPVIVAGHSMGGLLAADAATDTSHKAHRIIGVLAFDTPYLGMHPHVVISGIASLFPKDNEEDKKEKPTEWDMNEEHVQMVDDAVTDDWGAFKNNLQKPEGSHSSISLGSQVPSPNRSPSPQLSPSHSQTLSPASSSGPMQLVDRTLSHPFISGPLKFLSAHTDDPVVRWARKHSDHPFAAGKRWIVEHFQFGSCMFDIPGLKERYAKLVAWDGLWVNYWTETLPRKKEHGTIVTGDVDEKDIHQERLRDNDVALLEMGMAGPSSEELNAVDAVPEHLPEASNPLIIVEARTQAEIDVADKAESKAAKNAEKARLKEEKTVEKALKKQREAALKGKKKELIRPRHFIVLPTGLGRTLGGGDNWESVVIGGVQDEVAAHCGLFIRNQNLDYDGFVEKVGKRVLTWCETV